MRKHDFLYVISKVTDQPEYLYIPDQCEYRQRLRACSARFSSKLAELIPPSSKIIDVCWARDRYHV